MPCIYNILIKQKIPKIILVSIVTLNLICCNQNNKKSAIIASIDHKSSGCFGGETSCLNIINTDGEMTAVLTMNKAKYSTTVDSDKLQVLNKFLKELKSQDFGNGCTTTNSYSVKIGNEKFEKKDDGCSWDGFDVLKNALFGQEMQQRLNSSQ